MNKAGRGKQFEAIIQNTLRTFGGHTIVKTDPAVTITKMLDKGLFQGRFKTGGQCDFEGGFQGIHVCLEAKDCHQEVFLKDRIRPGQWDRLYETWQMGAISGLLLRFAGEVADEDRIWLIEFGALRFLYERKARFVPDDIGPHNAYALPYGAAGRGAVILNRLDGTLATVAHRLSSDRLRG